MRPGQFDCRLGGKPARSTPAWNDWPSLGRYIAQTVPHVFEPVTDDRFSEACAVCGLNREEAVHGKAE